MDSASREVSRTFRTKKSYYLKDQINGLEPNRKILETCTVT
jgi:hypothetical protein